MKKIKENIFEIIAIAILILLQSITDAHVIQVLFILFVYLAFTQSKVYKDHATKNNKKTGGGLPPDDDELTGP